MIEAITDLFVERLPRATRRPVLAPASRLLVVDACGRATRVAELTELVERSSPVTASYVALARVDSVPEKAVFELLWLFVDDQSDLDYCGLYLRELGERFRGARDAIVGVGDVEEAKCSVKLSASMAGVAPPWRRGRELARGANCLTAELLIGHAVSA
ncbi:MAG: hypothetical protein ACRDKE_09840 [Solirubrobacterales bacterium]